MSENKFVLRLMVTAVILNAFTWPAIGQPAALGKRLSELNPYLSDAIKVTEEGKNDLLLTMSMQSFEEAEEPAKHMVTCIKQCEKHIKSMHILLSAINPLWGESECEEAEDAYIEGVDQCNQVKQTALSVYQNIDKLNALSSWADNQFFIKQAITATIELGDLLSAASRNFKRSARLLDDCSDDE